MSWTIQKASAYGGILLTRMGQILLREPANHFDGYVWTFAKGKPNSGDTSEQTALREVREETGYEAEIVDVLPGVFKGGTSTNAYFVMRHIGPQGHTDWETQGTCWASFDEAARLIEQTTNLTGRKRDLAVLSAAKVWFEANRTVVLPDAEPDVGKPATRADWNIQPMPVRFTTLPLDFALDPADAAAIRKGFIPSGMEEKWFAYFVDNTLFQHRSWTGFCIDQIHFVGNGDGLRATHAEVNRDPAQYLCTDDAEDIRRIENMVRELAERNQKKPEPSSTLSALQLAAQPNYLGQYEVVSQLIVDWFGVVLNHIDHQINYAESEAATTSLVRIMTEDDTGYVRMPGWHTESQLGTTIVKWFGLDEDYCAGESLAMIVSEGLAAVVAVLWKLSEPARNQGGDWDVFQERLLAMHAFVVSVFLGTHSVSFPDVDLKQLVQLLLESKPSQLEGPQTQLNTAANCTEKRLPAFKFADLGLEVGTVLCFKLNSAVRCVVATDNRVEFRGQVISLSAAAVLALKQAGRPVTAARGPDYWCYKNMPLSKYRQLLQP
ncbi:NUDIX domain protein [compost metagenome]